MRINADSREAFYRLEEIIVNKNVDYCGILNLLRQLVAAGAFTYTEAKRIAARISQETGADVLISL